MRKFKKYSFEDEFNAYCVFNHEENESCVEIIGAEQFGNNWYFFILETDTINLNRIEDDNYMYSFLGGDESEEDGNWFLCGAFNSLESLINGGDDNGFDASILRCFLENP